LVEVEAQAWHDYPTKKYPATAATAKVLVEETAGELMDPAMQVSV